mmetsp:Transcript_30651/g.46341  ORF Transcript_30651/g.46341 Transcript_30651/m.46341 type:complete len:103 (+) Transcript_30651:103-411(+)
MRALLGIFVVIIIIDGLIVKKCIMRGRPQEGRAVFMVDFDGGDVFLLLTSLLAIMAILDTLLLRFRNLVLALAALLAFYLGVDLVEMIGKRLILSLETTTNR